MRKWIIAAVVAVALFSIGAFAASFSLNAQDIASGGDTVASCSTGSAPQATVTWKVNDSNAVSTPTIANYLVTGAKITTAAACNGFDYRFAFEAPAGTEYLCKGNLDASGNADITFATGTCSPNTGTPTFTGIAATINVSDVSAASLLVAGNPVGVTTTP